METKSRQQSEPLLHDISDLELVLTTVSQICLVTKGLSTSKSLLKIPHIGYGRVGHGTSELYLFINEPFPTPGELS
jgi:hypothetical protein